MNRRTLELRAVIITFILMTLSIISIISLVILFRKTTDAKQADFWIDISLSFITSLFSAGIAYVVAIIQIKSTRRMEAEEREIQNKKNINLILIEMKDNIDVMDIIASSLKENPHDSVANNQFSISMWERLINKIEIPNDLMSDLLRVIKKKELVFWDKQIDSQEIIDFKKEYSEVYTKLENYLR